MDAVHLVTADSAARHLDLSKQTLARWRQVGKGPRFVRISQTCVRYRLDDLEAWVEDRIYSSTSDETSQKGGDHG